MKIYYEKLGKRVGPIEIEDIAPLELDKDTLVWFSGLDGWSKAGSLSQLDSYFEASPPPLPELDSGNSKLKESSYYDNTYGKESEAKYVGVLYLVLSVALFLFRAELSGSELKPIVSLVLLVLRIIAVLYAINIAGRQNRQKVAWGLFAFVFPSIALIILGNTKRILRNDKVTYDQEMRPNESRTVVAWLLFIIGGALMLIAVVVIILMLFNLVTSGVR